MLKAQMSNVKTIIQNSNLTINPEKEGEDIIIFIRKIFKETGFGKTVIGLSGGIDSATAAFLAVKGLGRDNVITVMLPYGEGQNEEVKDARSTADKLEIPRENVIETDIEPLCRPYLNIIKNADRLRRGNATVRMRMLVLFDLAKKYRALVMGTENKSEYIFGYFTRFGDEASDIEPIRHLYKTQVRQLGEYLNLPRKIIEKEPTAGLWKGQSDEGELGFTYKEADEILFLLIDRGLSKMEIIEKGYKSETVEKVLLRIKQNEFKHRLPYEL